MPQSVKVVALIANMKTPEVIYIPPIKKNVLYSVLEKPKNIGNYFGEIITRLKNERATMNRILQLFTALISKATGLKFFITQLMTNLNFT